MNEHGKTGMNQPSRMHQPVAIITGASSGLGRSFATALDQRLPQDITFWLIARYEKGLQETAAEMNRAVRLLPLDLTLPESFDSLNTIFENEQPTVCYLINNAGRGRAGYFEEETLVMHRSLSDLNVRAPLLMTSLTLPYMKRGSRVLFTASVAAFLPQPGFASYAASKAMILSFGRALAEELRPRGIYVAVTCPNPMMTNFFSPEEKDAFQNSFKRISIEDPDVVAKKTLAAVERGKKVIVTGGWGKCIRMVARIVPTSWMIRIVGWLMRRDRLHT